MQELAKEFMAQKRFALVGATANTSKNGYRIFKNLTRRGYEVYPVNPGLDRIWLQPGSESEAALAFCRENKLRVVYDICVMQN